MDDVIVDFKPRSRINKLPRGVFFSREFRVYDHEAAAWVVYQQFLYEGSCGGVAHITLRQGKSLEEGLRAAQRLLQENDATFLSQPAVYGVSNSVKNHDDLHSGAPLPLAIARSGAYTERSVGRILEIFTGNYKIQPSRLNRLMADRPALTFPYRPYAADSYRRLKPAFTPPEIKMKYVTPFGTTRNEVLLAGRIVNRWSDGFYQRVLQDVDYPLWITEGEKKSMCLALPPLLLGTKMDVVGIPGVWMWGSKQGDSHRLAPELEAYRYEKDGQHRLVGILFDQDSWRKPQVAHALVTLCKALRDSGAMVFVAIIPPGPKQKGIDDFFGKHCSKEEQFDFAPLLDLMDRSVYVDRDYTVVPNPPPEVAFRLKTLAEASERFVTYQEEFQDRSFFDLERSFVDTVISDIGRFLDPNSSDLNGSRFLSEFRSWSEEKQQLYWVKWLEHNPFQSELDLQLDRYIPGVFRGRAASNPRVSYGQVRKNPCTPEQLKDLNYF